LTSLFFIHSCF